MLYRKDYLEQLQQAISRSRVVLLAGTRQCGKTTLARRLLSVDSVNYFDLENPLDLARLEDPMTALSPLQGLVVIDEVQRRPELFPVLRVLADRENLPARFLVLGSASGELQRQSSESLAGRVERLVAAFRCLSLPTTMRRVFNGVEVLCKRLSKGIYQPGVCECQHQRCCDSGQWYLTITLKPGNLPNLHRPWVLTRKPFAGIWISSPMLSLSDNYSRILQT